MIMITMMHGNEIQLIFMGGIFDQYYYMLHKNTKPKFDEKK